MVQAQAKAVEVDALSWHQLSGEAFEEALSGVFDDNYKRVKAAWLEHPKLKYFMPRSVLCRGADTRVFFMATVNESGPKSKVAGRSRAIAILEIAAESGYERTVGIKYVTVDEGWRRHGIAKRLYSNLVSHLKAGGLRLYRTRPGQETPGDFTTSVTALLEESGVVWFRRDV